MKVLIYVEGPSDKLAMEQLLEAVISQKYASGIQIEFIIARFGDRKEDVVMRAPQRAVNILRNDPLAVVAVMPDLHPKNKGVPHETPLDLKNETIAVFEKALKNKGVEDARIRDRFHVFCFKHDLEALVLACEEALKIRLDAQKFVVGWHKPVEDQNDKRWPKMVVEELFQHHNSRYQETVDAPLILGLTGLSHVVEACPQCFKPFVEFLESLSLPA